MQQPTPPQPPCLCPAVVHVIDAVLLPAHSIQYVLPYDQAVGGLQTSSPPALPGQQPGPTGCFASLADAIAATPQLSIAKTTLGLTGVRVAAHVVH